MSNIFPNKEMTKEQLISAYEEMGEKLSKEYGKNALLKIEVKELREDLKSIRSKIHSLYIDHRFDKIKE